MEKGDTWPKVLARNYEVFGDRRKAMRYKHYGIWQPYTWKDYYLEVKYTALGLSALGFEFGDKLLIVGDNAHEWYAGQLAAQANHGVLVGAYSELAASEIEYIVRDSEATFAMVEDQEQVDKLLDIRQRLPLLKRIVYWNYKGLAHYSDPLLLGHRELLQLGKDYEGECAGRFEENVRTGNAQDICAMIYTQGTTGEAPKGVFHTYETMKTAAEVCLQLDPWFEKDDIVPFLPPAWITEQCFAVGCHLLSGSVLNLAEEPETLLRDTTEIEPTVAFYGARVWESQAANLQARMLGATGLKNLAYRLFMPIGYRTADVRSAKKRTGILLKGLSSLAGLILYNRMRKSLGLSNARICYSTGGLLSTDALRFYHALGIPVKSVYATTEGGILAYPGKDDVDPETVGRPVPGGEVKLTDSNEILFRQPRVFAGRYKDNGTNASPLKDGWLRTGDAGFIRNDGHLVFLDRLCSIVKLTNGEKMLPQLVESRLRSSPYLKDAWVVAEPAGTYVSAIIVINYDTVSRWAGQEKLTFSTFVELSQNPDVYALVKKDIERVNASLTPGCRIRRYINLDREFDPDAGEVTRTRNLRRRVLEERYRGLIGAIYDDKNEVTVEVPIYHSDGRTERKSITLRIESAEGALS